MIFDLAECEEIACHSFRDKQMLRTAFTHTSYANEHNTESYERLEYLGDALLDFLVAEYQYRTYPKMAEGEMTTLRARLVSKPALKQIALDLRLGDLVLLGEGGERSGERNNDKILSSLIESLLGAVYLDGGIEAAVRFAEKRILPEGEKAFAKVTDYKTELQEFVQKRKLGPILYTETGRSGPDHSPVFSVAVSVKGRELAVGKGGKKQAAEQDAAKGAITVLKGGEKAFAPDKKGEGHAAKTAKGKSAKERALEKPKKEKPQKAKKVKRENPVLSLVADYGEPRQQSVKKEKPPKGEPKQKKQAKQRQEIKAEALSDGGKAEDRPTVKEPAPLKKEKRAFRERPMPKNKPEKKKSFLEFAGDTAGFPEQNPVKKQKKEKAAKVNHLFPKKRSKGGDGTPL